MSHELSRILVSYHWITSHYTYTLAEVRKQNIFRASIQLFMHCCLFWIKWCVTNNCSTV